MRHYCTVFDSKYLERGLALYDSLEKYSSEPFRLWALSLDEEPGKAWNLLETKTLLNLNSMVVPLSIHGFRWAMELDEVRANRTYQEWCWTCASQFMQYLITEYSLPEMTYLDADTAFFSDPEIVFKEIGSRSIAVTPHRLIPSKRHLERNGKFNVGWVTFKADDIGLECLSRWARQCRERCSSTVGCGDQGYLDEWPELYGNALCIIKNIGVNAGPWSIGNWKVTEGPKLDGVPIVLYHFHELMPKSDGTFLLTNYELRDEDIEFIYKPYLDSYKAIRQRIEAVHLPSLGR